MKARTKIISQNQELSVGYGTVMRATYRHKPSYFICCDSCKQRCVLLTVNKINFKLMGQHGPGLLIPW